MAKVKLTPVNDWQKAWKWASVQFNAVGVTLMGAAQLVGDTWSGVPVTLQQHLPHASTVAMVLFGMGMVGRVLKLADPEE